MGSSAVRLLGFFLPTPLAFVLGCASAGVVATGPQSYAPLPASTEVLVFASEKDVKNPFQVVGMLHYSDPGKYHNRTLEDAIPDLKEKAREVGGNGILIDSTERIVSGIISRGIEVKARAIRVGNPP